MNLDEHNSLLQNIFICFAKYVCRQLFLELLILYSLPEKLWEVIPPLCNCITLGKVGSIEPSGKSFLGVYWTSFWVPLAQG